MKEQLILPVLSFLFAAATPLWADVTYYDPVGGTNATCTAYEAYTDQTTLTSGWYVVTGGITNDTRIAVDGDVHLILADGAALTANAGINVDSANHLTVWAQSDGAKMGKLRATGVSDAAGIGGEFGCSGGMVTINGGNVTAYGGSGGGGHTATVTGSEVQYSGTVDVQWLNDTELLLKFIDDGSFVLPGLSKVRILAVGGGGGGAGVCSASSAMVSPYGGGAGGGAGGVVEITNILPAATYVVSVGAGGAGGSSASKHAAARYNGASGGDTTLTTNGVAVLTAKGGGGGGGEAVGLVGGSGGGGSQYRVGSKTGQPRAGGSGTAGQGYAGGAGDCALYGGGGGGAGGAGAAASTLNPVGGDGRASDITCNDGEDPVWYAGGGGGGYSDKSFTGLHDPIAGGKGGGGAGGYGANVACAGATFYGGGGGGGGAVGTNATTPGGNGYQGVVYVRISIATSGAIVKPTNQTVAFDGTEHVLVTASPAYVITDLTEGSPTYGQIVSRVAATDCGTCKAKVELVDGFEWLDGTKTVETVTLTINRTKPVISDLRIRDWIAGTPDSATPNPSCRVSIAVEPTYTYGDSATGPWSAEKPTAAGTHYLRASIAETENCDAAESVSSFTIFDGPGDIYGDHVEITIGAASSPVSEFVYELRFAEGAPVGFLYERAGETGEDLTITDANGVVLDYTVGTWNTAGESRLYVKLPELSTSPQVIRLFWCVREGKTPPSHTACGIPSGDPQPSFDFDLVERAGKRVNYWLTSPSLTKTKWSTDDPEDEKGKVVSCGTVAEGLSSFLYATNLNTGAISPGIPTTGGSFSAVFGPYDPVGDYEPFEYGIDVLVVGHGVGYGGGAGIGGGCWGNGGVIVINGGDVLAEGGGSGAGIGGGYGGGAGGEVTISGGMVMGGGFNGGAGIGGGLDGSGGNVTITGGDEVSALSNSGGCAGIGVGAGGIGGTVTIKPTVGIAIQVEAGVDASATRIDGSPFTAETDLVSHISGHCFVRTSASNYLEYLDPTDPDNPVKARTDFKFYTGQTTLTSGWYVVTGDIANDATIAVDGDVHLILADGASLAANAGINVGGANRLTIWAQSDGANMGRLSATGASSAAGIGGGLGGSCGTVTVNGGKVTAHGSGGAGIGGGMIGAGGIVTVNGGEVEAQGSSGAAGIGGGFMGYGGTVTISGGKVTAHGYSGAGIAPGIGAGGSGSGGTVTIKPVGGKMIEVGVGGDWLAPFTAETDVTSLLAGKLLVQTRAFMGYLDPTDPANPVKVCDDYAYYTDQTTLTSGWYVVTGNITKDERITVDGDVHLILADGASLTANKGINVDVNNNVTNSLMIWAQSDGANMGNLTAQGGDSGAAGIGGGVNGSGGSVTVNGGKVEANGGTNAAGIGGGLRGYGGTVTINGGEVTATGGDGIGAGASGAGGTVTIKPAGGNKLAVEAGADAGSAAPVAGSPFAMETDVTSLLAENLFVHVGKAFAEGDIALTDYAGTYDGLAHTIGIATNAIPGLALQYSSPSSPPSPSTTLPLFTNVTNVTVSVEASAPGYITFTTNATVKIAPRTVTLTSGSAEKVYDGTPVTCADVVVGGDGFLTSEGATYDVTGTQTHVGVGTNTFTYVLNAGTFAINYAIVTSNGTLTVTKATNAWTTDPSLAGWTYGETAGTPDFGGAAFGTATVTYSAEPGDAGDYTATFTVAGTEDYDGLTFEVPFTIARATFADGDIALTDYAGVYDGLAHTIGIATNAIPGLALQYSSPSSPASPSTTLPLFTDVTNVTVSVEASAPNYETFTTNATVTIAPRTVTLTSGSAEKVYDGTALTCADVLVGGDGFADGEGATCDATGSQAHVGVGTNTFTYALNAGTFAINYEIVTSNGTLTVTKTTNVWTTEPSISGWTYGEAAGVPQMGEAKFGTVAVSYGASGTELPSVAGDYVATFTVEGTADYSGLTKEVPFTIEPEPTPDPEPDGGGEELPTKDEVFAGAVDTQFAAGQELLGALYDADGNVVGAVTLKFGKRNRRTGKVKLTASATIIVDGAVKKVGAKAVRFKADEWAAERMIEFKQPIGSMTLASEGERFTLRNESYMMKGLAVDAKSGAERDVKVGGSLPGKAMRFRMEIGSLPTLPGGYAFVPSSFPADVTMNVAGVRRVVSGRASARKVTLEYVIKGLDAIISPKLKLKYVSKTGLFKGLFKVYATMDGNKRKRKGYTVKVVGFMVDGVGVGCATLKKPSAKWPVTLE